MNSNDEDVGALRRRRGTILAACTRIRTFTESVTSVTPSVAAQLEDRRLKLDGYWSEYDFVQGKLEVLDESETEHRATFEDSYYALTARMREMLCLTAATRASASPSPSSSGVAMPQPFGHIRLPKLELPRFSGRYDEWCPFFDSFNSLIHVNASLSDVQKLQYLRSSLTGDAAKIISALEISDANYKVAWDLLKERYDNRRAIVQSHIKAILELPSMAKENVAELRQIADGAIRHIHALQALKRPTSQWDDLLVYILSSKLDALTLREWQLSLTGAALPTLKQFTDFVAHRCITLETSHKSKNVNARSQSQTNAKQQACVALLKAKCVFCKGEHLVYHCERFVALPVPQRIAEIRKRKLCANCLRHADHTVNKCSSGSCRICKAKHNTLLHLTVATAGSDVVESQHRADNESAAAGTTSATVLSSIASSDRDGVMLSTAVAFAQDGDGRRKACCILLDSGSQANFVSRSITLNCIVTERVTGKLPAVSFKRVAFEIPRNLELADPQFHVASEVDILIGAEHFWNLLCVGQIQASPLCPTLQKTRFGWILAGRSSVASGPSADVRSFHASVTNTRLHEQLARFWDIENIATAPDARTAEEMHCEHHFTQNMSRTEQGRFVVKLPFIESIPHAFVSSRDIALRRFKAIEKRLNRDSGLKEQYSQFKSEYNAMGHMAQLGEGGREDTGAFYLPHHCITKALVPNKFRVVFDASAKDAAGVSLNDILMVGPTVQQDLFTILLRFRTFRYALSADIVKMYRQVQVHPSQTRYQRILWLDESNSKIVTYELLTLTYGTSSASFLATRCLLWLSEHWIAECPSGAACVGRDFYVDDMLTGADTLSEAMTIRDETIKVLRSGAFELGKWASSHSELLAGIRNQNDDPVTIQGGPESSVLGIHWIHSQDTFRFSYGPDGDTAVISKRTILSEIARLFDPLGLLGPVIVQAKIILQKLWQLGAHWDESVPQDLHTRWSEIKSQLAEINQLDIPRCVKYTADSGRVHVHGFCDASQRAYGACVYVRSEIGNNTYRVELLCAKSRVAPLKALSLPRLELSAALLLSRLMHKIRSAFDLNDMQLYLWSDSTIVLNWISSPSRRWSVFVAHRVGEIQGLTDTASWRHVRSEDNPADLLSRGLSPHDLLKLTMWWHGPTFLQRSAESWPSSEFACAVHDLPERRKCVAAIAISDYSIVHELLSRHSRIAKTCRVIAYCLRVSKSRRPCDPDRFISPQEILIALQVICKSVQQQAFSAEYKALSEGRAINATSSVLALSPFISKDGLMRVGGRLANWALDYDARHPILLPRNHVLTQRVIRQEHERNAHAGLQATMAAVRQRYWPISLRSATRKVVRNCVTCFKLRPAQSHAIMAPLPAGRVTPSRPFMHCGVDYAGPFAVRESRRRNARTHKAYLAVFVCFATKCVHLELVGDLTADAFIAALKRFASRRGKPSCIYSDNGKTFVGAQGQLKEFFNFLRSEQAQTDIAHFLREQETTWRFIPPYAPHFGGLWEAAVKSAKNHLGRIVGNASLTFEELATTFCEIEAILNSRPITPLSEDPNDLSYLSPGHFIIGTALNSFPSQNLHDVNEGRLGRWQRIEQARQHFWRRWSQEYLHTLQERTKWRASKGEQLKAGQIVLLKQPGLAALQWLPGRVEELHPGSDGITRAATIRTARGLLTRPLTKIAILPMER